MTQEVLDSMIEDGAKILIYYGNGYLDARLRGTGQDSVVIDELMRAHYLYGILKSIVISGGVMYSGSAVISEADVLSAYQKLWHYSGYNVDLSVYSAVTEDDGDGGSVPVSGTETTTDHYRSGIVAVTAGVNVISFSSPLASTDYTITVSTIDGDGYEQTNLVVSAKTKTGFVVDDVLADGTLTYLCTIEL